MRKFQDAYREAMEELPQLSLDASQLMEGEWKSSFGKEKEGSFVSRHKALARVAAAAAIFLLCGAGTVTAVNYHKSSIQVKENGYSVVSEGMQIYQTEEGLNEGQARMLPGNDGGMDAGEMDTEVPSMELEAFETVEYTSLDEFLAKEDVTIAIPDPDWLGTAFDTQEIYVMEEGDHIMVSLMGEGKSFFLGQQDVRDYEGYASSTAYMGESVNERNFTNSQGLSYVVFDTMEDGVITSTHAVISVNGRDLSMDFYGYEEAVIEKVLQQLDLSVYFRD